jgi:hypothetical protein
VALTEVFSGLHESYGLSFSFASNATDSCFINLNETFLTPELAIQALCETCDFDFKKINNVYIIIDVDRTIPKINPKKQKYIYKIHISEIHTNERLGLSKIKIDGHYYLADINGNFSFISKEKRLQFEISHLAYINMDTLLIPSELYQSVELLPFSKDLDAIEVFGKQSIEHISIGKSPGKLSVNSESKGFLAGESNNAIFNTLRLQPGILSAGEQSSDYVIWNSYKGQNHLIFDGITLFKANTYNQTISGVNPSIIKTIDIYKGGYNADIGDRVGSVIDIRSRTGNFNKVQTIFNLNNQLVNCYLNIPLKSKANLQASVRHTFENPFDIEFNTLNKNYIRPETNFTDVNFKFSTLIKDKNPFRVSMIFGDDSYKESLKDKFNKEIAMNSSNSVQGGFSLYYGKNWNHGDLTDVSISYSLLSTEFTNQIDLKTLNLTFSSIDEQSVKISHSFRATKYHHFKLGLNLIHNSSYYRNDSSSYNFKNNTENLTRLNFYVTDSWNLGKRFKFDYGLKLESPIQLNRLFFQPRLSIKYASEKNFNIYASWGRYNQFMSELAVIDQYQNNLFHWSILDSKYTPNQSFHYVFGTSIIKNTWKLSTEGFYKITTNLQSFYLKNSEYVALSIGSAKTYGLDFFVSKSFNKHKLWMAYTLSQSHDYFDYYNSKSWQPAQQDQLHELKSAFVFNFNPIHVSINYVYGSGLTYVKSNGSRIRLPYNRLDIAFKYCLNIKNIKSELGFSILNVLNSKNLNLNSFSNFPEQENQFVLSTPFTPLVFIKVMF